MKIKLIHLLLSAFTLLVLTSCDVVEGPKVDPEGFSGSANKVLIEDFTGHMCGNCPRAHEQATALHDTYGDNLVIVAVHAGTFARVVNSLGFTTDFNTEMGAKLEEEYDADNAGLPKGLINRRQYGGSYLTNYPDWSTHVSTVLAESPQLGLEMVSTYDDNSREFEVDVNMEYFTTGDATHQVVVLITEDHIISKQNDYSLASGHIDDYEQNHVLRAVVTPGVYGVPVKGSEIFLGEKITKTFNMVLPAEFVAENCHIVSYVLTSDTHEIIQVDEIKLTE